MNEKRANLCLVFVAIVWGGGFIATSIALDTFTPFMTMALRFMISAFLLLLLFYKRIKNISFSMWKHGGICGTFLFLAFAFQTIGLDTTTAGKNAFLTAANVVFLPYLLWMIKKRKPSLKQMVASFLCICGVGLLTLTDVQEGINIGDILSLVCAVFFALHMMSLEKYQAIDSICLTFMQMLVAGIWSLGALCFVGFQPIAITPESIYSLSFLILCSTMMAYLIQTKAQQYTKASTTSLILANEAVFAVIFSALILHEEITILAFLGICLIFLSVQISIRSHP